MFRLIHVINKKLIKEFVEQQKAASEFRRHLSDLEKTEFDKAWKEYNGGDENHPDFLYYLTPETWPDLFLDRVNKILKYAKKT
jgi:hypothetical protein